MPASPFAPSPEAEAIAAGDLQRNLPDGVRKVMLDVVLAWANLDMATALFVSSVLGLNPDQGADRFSRKIIENKLKTAAEALESRGNNKVAAKVRTIAEAYPEKAHLRRRIAHTKCAGVRTSSPDFIVFMPFEREGPPGHLAIEIYHISKFVAAMEWANEVEVFLMAHVDSSDFFQAG